MEGWNKAVLKQQPVLIFFQCEDSSNKAIIGEAIGRKLCCGKSERKLSDRIRGSCLEYMLGYGIRHGVMFAWKDC